MYRDFTASNKTSCIVVTLVIVSLLLIHNQQVTGGHGYVILGTEANEQQALNYGCIVEDTTSHKVCIIVANYPASLVLSALIHTEPE